MHIYTCVVGVRNRRVSTGGPTADSAGEEGGADCAKSRRGAEWYEDTQEAEHHWPREETSEQKLLSEYVLADGEGSWL